MYCEDGTKTYEPLDVMAKDAPETCAEYAIENKLVNKPGWKRFQTVCQEQEEAHSRTPSSQTQVTETQC